MYVNNIAERSSSRVLQRPGGAQSFNIFGGNEDEAPQQRTGKRLGPQQPAATAASNHPQVPGAAAAAPAPAPVVPASSDAAHAPAAFTDASNTKAVPVEIAPAASAPPAKPVAAHRTSVNNIWGSDEQENKPSTRVIKGPGGGSSGVAGIFGGADAAPAPQTARGNRSNQTSANSPFATDSAPAAGQSNARPQQQRGGGNIISWQ